MNKKLGARNEVGTRYFMFHAQLILCSNPYSFLMVVVPKSQARPRNFVKDRPEPTPWRKMVTLTLK